jgi:hypothetical protein
MLTGTAYSIKLKVSIILEMTKISQLTNIVTSMKKGGHSEYPSIDGRIILSRDYGSVTNNNKVLTG